MFKNRYSLGTLFDSIATLDPLVSTGVGFRQNRLPSVVVCRCLSLRISTDDDTFKLPVDVASECDDVFTDGVSSKNHCRWSKSSRSTFAHSAFAATAADCWCCSVDWSPQPELSSEYCRKPDVWLDSGWCEWWLVTGRKFSSNKTYSIVSSGWETSLQTCWTRCVYLSCSFEVALDRLVYRRSALPFKESISWYFRFRLLGLFGDGSAALIWNKSCRQMMWELSLIAASSSCSDTRLCILDR